MNNLKSIFAYLFLLLSIQVLLLTANGQDNNVQESIESPEFSLSINKNFNTRAYLLGPNDVLSIFVYDSPEFDQTNIRVHPDGKILVSPFAPIYVAGRTISELRSLLTLKYKYYLKDPKVTIKLEQVKPFLVYVTGAVANPGSYELNTDTSKNQYNYDSKPEIQIERKTPLLSNILVAAGGILYDADLENIKVSNSITQAEIKVNLLDLLENSNSNQDVYLMAGDTVFVPKLPTPLAVEENKYKKFASATFSPKYVPVKVFGYVNHPGLIKLDPSQSLNINSAITSAGGYLTDSAYSPKTVYISRLDTSGKLVTKAVNPMSNDITLMPNDIVYVPEKIRPLIGKSVDYMTRLFTPINTFANLYNNWALMFDPDRYQVIGK